MATPDYLQQVIVSGRRSARGERRAFGTRASAQWRPSVASLVVSSLDVVTIFVAWLLALWLRSDVPPEVHFFHVLPYILTHSPTVTPLYIGGFALCAVFFMRSYGLYTPLQYRSGLHEQRMVVQSTFTAGLILCGALYVLRELNVSRLVVFMVVTLSIVLMCVRRAVWRRIVYKRYLDGIETRNVMIVGAGRVGHALRNHLESLQHLGFRFKGFVALTEREAETGDADVVGDLRNCVAIARSLFVDEIFFSVPAAKKLVINLVEEARSAGIDVRVVPDLYDGLAWNAPVEYIGQFPTIPLHRREFPVGAFLMKRVLDISLSTLALAVTSPLTLMLMLAVKMDSEGPILYRAQRIGRKGRTFVCYKFRTMVVGADHMKADLAHMNEREGVLFKMQNDPRVTKVGRFIRKYSLDELPQFYNVLKGDMSLVGPRPPIASEVEQYDLPHLRRLDVLPGITGLWQVEARQDPSFDSYISLDTAYVENWSLWLDLKILARTISVVIGGTGS